MAKRKKYKQFYTYECSITGEQIKVTKQAKNSEDLISLAAYYDLNPDMDDRSEAYKTSTTPEEKTENTSGTKSLWEELVEIATEQKAKKEAEQAALLAQQANQ